jgi:hypothetical protein
MDILSFFFFFILGTMQQFSMTDIITEVNDLIYLFMQFSIIGNIRGSAGGTR